MAELEFVFRPESRKNLRRRQETHSQGKKPSQVRSVRWSTVVRFTRRNSPG